MNLRPSSSPTGRSSENGVSAQQPFTFSSFSCGMPVSFSSSSSVGSRPVRAMIACVARATRLYVSSMCTGMRTARPLSASARLIA